MGPVIDPIGAPGEPSGRMVGSRPLRLAPRGV